MLEIGFLYNIHAKDFQINVVNYAKRVPHFMQKYLKHALCDFPVFVLN